MTDAPAGGAVTIVYLINHLDWFWSHRLPLARKVQELGWEVTVAAPGATTAPTLQALGFRPAEIPAASRERPLAVLIRSLCRFGCLLKRERPEILHAITLKTALPAALAARWFGGDVIFVATLAGLGYLFHSSALKARLARRLLTPVFRYAFAGRNTWVIFQNSDDRDTLARLRAIRAERSTVILGSGVDLRQFPFAAPPSEPTPIVLMAARLVRDKGIMVFAEAARLLKARGIDARFMLAGGLDATNPAALSAEEMQALTADGALEWLGHVADLSQLYARCSVFVYPSYYGEGVPKVLLEAAATGRPIVTTDHPGCREVVTEGVNGLLVRTQDARATADAIAHLLDDAAKRARFGRQSRDRAVRDFDVETIVRQTVAFYALARATASSVTPDGDIGYAGRLPAALRIKR